MLALKEDEKELTRKQALNLIPSFFDQFTN